MQGYDQSRLKLMDVIEQRPMFDKQRKQRKQSETLFRHLRMVSGLSKRRLRGFQLPFLPKDNIPFQSARH